MKNMFLLLLFIGAAVSAQQSGQLAGQVYAGAYLAGEGEISIQNTTQKRSTRTIAEGYFSIAAKRGDTLVFTGDDISRQAIVLSRKHFRDDVFVFRLASEATQLSEVRVNRAAPLTGLNEGKKVYTPAERKLQTSRNVSAQRTPEREGVAALGTDPLINAISGNTAQRKKELEVERKLALQDHLTQTLGKEYFTKTLGIPSENVDGFLFYVAEQPESEKQLREGTAEDISFELSRMATQYLKLQNARGN